MTAVVVEAADAVECIANRNLISPVCQDMEEYQKKNVLRDQPERQRPSNAEKMFQNRTHKSSQEEEDDHDDDDVVWCNSERQHKHFDHDIASCGCCSMSHMSTSS
jgi:hypothetical protein